MLFLLEAKTSSGLFSPSEFKDYISIISVSIVILTFTIDRLVASRTRKIEFLRTWYYKSLFEPNLEKIEIFYTETLVIFSKGYKKLKSLQGPDIIIKTKGKINSEFQELKRSYEFDVLSVIKWCIPSLDLAILNFVLELEDSFVTTIDSYKSPNDLELEFRSYLMAHKARFYILLHESLKTPKKNFSFSIILGAIGRWIRSSFYFLVSKGCNFWKNLVTRNKKNASDF